MSKNKGATIGKRTKPIIILITIICFLFSGIYAYAQEYEIERIQGLKWEIIKDINESPHKKSSPSVRLTWSMKVQETNNGIFPREVRVIRTTLDKDFMGAGTAVFYSGPAKDGYIEVEYIERPPVGSLYKYQVYCPDPKLSMIKTTKMETGVINFTEEYLDKYFGENPGPIDGTDNNEEKKKAQEARERYKETADWPERLLSDIIVSIPNFLIKVIGLYDPIELAYGIDIDSSKLQTVEGSDMKYQDNSEYFGLFSEAEMRNAIGPLYDTFNELAPIQMVMILSIVGLVYMFRSVYPDTKLTAREYVSGFLFAMLMLKFGPAALNFFSEINQMFVKVGLGIVLGQYPDAFNSGFIDAIYDPDSALLGDAIIACLAAFSVGVVNWQYAMRKLTIAVLIAILPVTLVISIFPTRREALGIWIKEMSANMFLPSAHAMVIAFMILFLWANNSETASTGDVAAGLLSQTFIMKLAVVMGLTTISSLVRRVIGAESLGSGALGAVGTGLGFAGIAAVGRILQQGRKSIPSESISPWQQGGSESSLKPVPGSNPATLGERLDSFARRGTQAISRTAGRVAGGAVKVGVSSVGAMTGAMVGGALTGNESMGAASGAMLANIYGGEQAGEFVKKQTEGVTEAAGNAGLYGLKVATGGPAGFDQANNDLGMTTEGIKYNPELAKDAGTKILGNNIPGKIVGQGLSYAAKNRIMENPGLSSGVKNLNRNMADSRTRLADIQQTVMPQAEAKLEVARANFSEAKNLYSPKSEAMKKLDSSSTEYQQNLEKFDIAKADLEGSEAAHAKLQSEQAQLTQAIEQNSLHEQMKELAQRNQTWSGGRLGNEWNR